MIVCRLAYNGSIAELPGTAFLDIALPIEQCNTHFLKRFLHENENQLICAISAAANIKATNGSRPDRRAN
jgi:hypothetical protein